MLTRGVAEYLLGQLEDRDALLVVAQALEPDIDMWLRETRPGSRARKVPRDLAHIGRRPPRLVTLAARGGVSS